MPVAVTEIRTCRIRVFLSHSTLWIEKRIQNTASYEIISTRGQVTLVRSQYRIRDTLCIMTVKDSIIQSIKEGHSPPQTPSSASCREQWVPAFDISALRPAQAIYTPIPRTSSTRTCSTIVEVTLFIPVQRRINGDGRRQAVRVSDWFKKCLHRRTFGDCANDRHLHGLVGWNMTSCRPDQRANCAAQPTKDKHPLQMGRTGEYPGPTCKLWCGIPYNP